MSDPLVIVVGAAGPAISVSWEPPQSQFDSGFVVIYSECNPLDAEDETPSRLVCLHCLVRDGDVQLGRGLDLARRYGQVDWDGSEWVVPAD